MSDFSETTGLLSYMRAGATSNIEIVQGTNSKYVRFVQSDGVVKSTAMLAKKVLKIDATNIRDLDVSWVEGVTEDGSPIKGFMVHTRGVVEIISSFSIAEMDFA